METFKYLVKVEKGAAPSPNGYWAAWVVPVVWSELVEPYDEVPVYAHGRRHKCFDKGKEAEMRVWLEKQINELILSNVV